MEEIKKGFQFKQNIVRGCKEQKKSALEMATYSAGYQEGGLRVGR